MVQVGEYAWTLLLCSLNDVGLFCIPEAVRENNCHLLVDHEGMVREVHGWMVGERVGGSILYST